VAARRVAALTEHPTTRRVADLLAAYGARGEVRELDASTRTARDAAAALGCEVGAIASTLVFMADGAPLIIMTSGAHRVDVDRVAALLGATGVRQATPDEVRTVTGFAIGGVAPVGHPQPLQTLIDEDLGLYPVLWAAAGTGHSVFSTTFDELVAMTGGEVVRVA
jgi:prolyl-tRNA editing enzyme YbaK/EbsC (Cys-tRNA(Pro) deacylase)